MIFNEHYLLRNGKDLLVRSAKKEDAKEYLEMFYITHIETDFNISYVEECKHTIKEEEEYLTKKEESNTDIELVAIIDNKIVGNASINQISNRLKLKHRAEFGVSIIKEYWGCGVGTVLLKVCIDLAKQMGYKQLELDVVSNNDRAISLYKRYGFIEFGRNKKAFISKYSGYQELVYMALDVEEK